ncbi:hypothetical protein V2J09_013417 [Rumex salicifolius]
MAEEEEAAALAPEEITFGLPDEILQVLPSDPFTQLDVARRITSLALATRVSALESEAADLRHHLSDKDQIIDDLRSRIESLDTALSDATDKLAAAQQEKEELLQEKAHLSNTVRKLNRDVSKLEVFRKTLMQSLQEDEDGSGGAKAVPGYVKPTSQSIGGDDDPVEPPSAYSSMQSQTSEPGNSFAEIRDSDAEHRLRISPGLLLASQTNTPKLTPPGSPPVLSASASPKTSKPASPRRHSVSFATSRGMFDIASNPTSNPYTSYDGGSQARTARVDGKEFFRQVRSRLSYEQFGAFLANVKELNSHKKTKEDTLLKAEEIFGSENKDLYTIFEGLLSRNLH